MLQEVADQLVDTARWRREKANEFPHDRQRNEGAAEMLEKMAKEMLTLDPDLPLVKELERLHDKACNIQDRALEDFLMAESALYRGVGFGYSDAAHDFLECLLDCYQAAVEEPCPAPSPQSAAAPLSGTIH